MNGERIADNILDQFKFVIDVTLEFNQEVLDEFGYNLRLTLEDTPPILSISENCYFVSYFETRFYYMQAFYKHFNFESLNKIIFLMNMK